MSPTFIETGCTIVKLVLATEFGPTIKPFEASNGAKQYRIYKISLDLTESTIRHYTDQKRSASRSGWRHCGSCRAFTGLHCRAAHAVHGNKIRDNGPATCSIFGVPARFSARRDVAGLLLLRSALNYAWRQVGRYDRRHTGPPSNTERRNIFVQGYPALFAAHVLFLVSWHLTFRAPKKQLPK